MIVLRVSRGTVLLAAGLLMTAQLLAATAALGETLDYEPGRGLRLADGALTVGGYLSVAAEALDESRNHLAVEDVSILVTYQTSEHLSFFGEFELEDSIEVDSGGFGTGDDVFELERLYAEYESSPRLRLRAGQMLTTFGIWNLIHAEPLVWTTSRPIATERFFDTATTGIQIDSPFDLGGFDLTATAYLQPGDQFDNPQGAQQAHTAAGGRLRLGNGDRWHLGTSAVRFHDEVDKRWENTAGIDFAHRTRRWEFAAEAAANNGGSAPTTWGAYFQAVYHTDAEIHPVVRIEHVELDGTRGTPLIVGVAYKPASNIVFKLEGVIGTRGLGVGGNGPLASVNVLF